MGGDAEDGNKADASVVRVSLGDVETVPSGLSRDPRRSR